MPPRPKNLVRHGAGWAFDRTQGGKRVRQYLGTDFAEAKRQALILANQMDRAVFESQRSGAAAPERITVGQFADRWLTECVTQNRNPKGQALTRQRLTAYILPLLGPMPMAEVQVPQLRALRADLTAKGLAPMSVVHVLSDVRALLRYGLQCGLVPTVPAFRGVFPKIPEQAPLGLSEDDLRAILAAATPKEALVIELAAETGLRWGELLRLQWHDVKDRPHPHLLLKKTKSGKVRRVPLTARAEALLREERGRTGSVQVLPLRIKNFGPYAARIGRKAGVKWHFHQLRHTFATRWVNEGGSIETLQEILGHSDIKLTQRYGRISFESVFHTMRRLERDREVDSAKIPHKIPTSGALEPSTGTEP